MKAIGYMEKPLLGMTAALALSLLAQPVLALEEVVRNVSQVRRKNPGYPDFGERLHGEEH